MLGLSGRGLGGGCLVVGEHTLIDLLVWGVEQMSAGAVSERSGRWLSGSG